MRVQLLLSSYFASLLLGASPSYAIPDLKDTIVQLFEWSWDSVASECSAFIGSAGYGFVQVSPAVEHIEGPEWYTSYQTVSYKIQSKRGNRTQFSKMISACHTAGVKVIVDTVFNHMTMLDNGTGVAGSPFTHYDYPGIYQFANFHHCGLEPGDDIVNFTSRVEVQTCELVNLADLATETEYVQNRLAGYVKELVALGVDGLRLDLAKNVAASDIAGILSRVGKRLHITQEVAWGQGDEIQPSEYVGNGQVQEFRYTTALQTIFLNGSLSTLKQLVQKGWIPGSDANVFVANHDTERMDTSLNHDSPNNAYVLALVFSLASPYGAPTVLSSYEFTTYPQGAPNGGAGVCSGNNGTDGWFCQHRWLPVSGMVGFRNVVGRSEITDWLSPHPQQIAFGRGSLGYVAINNADTDWTLRGRTHLPDGHYCDITRGRLASNNCTGPLIRVSKGLITATVLARNALGVHVGAKLLGK